MKQEEGEERFWTMRIRVDVEGGPIGGHSLLSAAVSISEELSPDETAKVVSRCIREHVAERINEEVRKSFGWITPGGFLNT